MYFCNIWRRSHQWLSLPLALAAWSLRVVIVRVLGESAYQIEVQSQISPYSHELMQTLASTQTIIERSISRCQSTTGHLTLTWSCCLAMAAGTNRMFWLATVMTHRGVNFGWKFKLVEFAKTYGTDGIQIQSGYKLVIVYLLGAC
jgi:hypothetical protein